MRPMSDQEGKRHLARRRAVGMRDLGKHAAAGAARLGEGVLPERAVGGVRDLGRTPADPGRLLNLGPVTS